MCSLSYLDNVFINWTSVGINISIKELLPENCLQKATELENKKYKIIQFITCMYCSNSKLSNPHLAQAMAYIVWHSKPFMRPQYKRPRKYGGA